MTLIAPDNDFAMWAIMLLMVAMAFRLEKTTLGAKISGTIIVITSGALLSNFKIISSSNDVFDTIGSIGVPIAIILLLFNANLKKIFSESGPTLLAFIFGAIGTTLGTFIGIMTLPLGDKMPELAAIFSATYIGGSVNFVGVSNAIGFDDSNLLTASVAADNVVGVAFMAILIAIPTMTFMAKAFGYDANSKIYDDDDIDDSLQQDPPFSIERAVLALGIAFTIVTLSAMIAQLIGYPSARLLIITAIIVAIATFAHDKISRLTEAFPIGIAIMYLFLGMIGAGVDILSMLESGLLLALFALIILSVHLITLLSLSKIFKIGLPEALIGSNACILGAPTAAAMAGALGWKSLITPAVLCGTFGYVIANFIGLTIYGFLG